MAIQLTAFIPYDPSAFAVTTAWHNDQTGVILDADIEINELRGPYIDCQLSCTQGGCVGEKDSQGRQVVDLKNVLTHEAGHFFGLDHPALDPSDPDDESLATMWAKSPAGEVCKRVLKEDDIAGLQAIYPAETLVGSCDFTPYGGQNLNCGGSSEGCACSTSTFPQNYFILWGMFLALLFTRKKRLAKSCKAAIPHSHYKKGDAYET
ncbi:MAG: matrixin family metalloprotease [Myxococcales bacterium]|nr:MAG: matrixin family metalloprotease [Myxococcales bacterium]